MASQIGNNVQNIVIGIVAAVVFLLVGVALGPTVLEAAADVVNANLTTEGVPMGAVIELLATYIGFFFYLGIVLGAIAMIWAVVQNQT